MPSLSFIKYTGKTLKEMTEDYPDIVFRYKEFLCDFSVEDLDIRIQHKTCNAKYKDWMLELEKERYEKIKKESDRKAILKAIQNGLGARESEAKEKVEFAPNEHGLILPAKKVVSEPLKDIGQTVFPKIDGLKWEDIKITFNSHESVRIKAKHINKQYHFIEMGFGSKKHPDRPIKLWELLKEIARNGGTAKLKDHLDLKVGIRSGVKAFSDIRKILKKFFNLNSDPFHSYLTVHAYKPKFILSHTLQD